jgi:hypothetical protein
MVLLQNVLGDGRGDEVVARIDCIVANEFEYVSVEFIGSGLDLDIDVRSGIATILGGVVAGLYLEFLDGVDRGVEVYIVMPVVHHGDAVDVDLAPGHTASVGGDGRSIGARRVEVRIVDRNARRQNGQVVKLAAVERKVFGAFRADHFSQRGVLGLQQLLARLHDDIFLSCAHRQGEAQLFLLAYLDHDPFFSLRTKAVRLYGNVVGPGGEIAHLKFARRIRRRNLGDTGRRREDSDGCAGHHSA